MMGNKAEILDQFFYGVEDVIPNNFREFLESSEGSLKVKFGADPSAPDLHLGHVVVLNKLRLLQKLGHEVIFLVGDFTAMIGDPTGRSKVRVALDKEVVLKNTETYLEQVFKVLDQKYTKVVHNSEWLDKLSTHDVITLMSKYTVARMLERDDFSKRFNNNETISLHEFMYPMFQGYDSVVLKTDLEVGGRDQRFNFIVGRHLQREYGCNEQAIVTFPLLVGLDGIQKMSKSLNNYIALNDTSKDMFGKLMSIPDVCIKDYFYLLTSCSKDVIESYFLRLDSGENPRYIKEDLAKKIVTRFYSEEEACLQAEEFKRVFSEKAYPKDMETLCFSEGDSLDVILVSWKIVVSRRESRRLLQQQAVTINGEIVDLDYKLSMFSDDKILKVGKRRFFKLRMNHE